MLQRLLIFLLLMVLTLLVGLLGVAFFHQGQSSSPLVSSAELNDHVSSTPLPGEVPAAPGTIKPQTSTTAPDPLSTTVFPETQSISPTLPNHPPTLTPIPTYIPTVVDDTPTPVPANPPDIIDVTSIPSPTYMTTSIEDTPAPIPSNTEQVGSITFAVIGDYGSDFQGTHDVAALVRSWAPDFVITVGDNNYPDGAAGTFDANVTQHYGDYVAQGRFFPTLGNHDYYTAAAQPYFDYFNLPNNERYYQFLRGDVHFFAINSDWNEPDGISLGSSQANWLQEAITNSTAKWQIVYFHVPPFVSREESQVTVLRWPFANWGADLVLSGHAHIYERLLIDNIPYIVNGVGGHSIYAFDDVSSPYSQVRYNGDFGALHVNASADTLTLQFVTRGNQIIDTHTLYAP